MAPRSAASGMSRTSMPSTVARETEEAVARAVYGVISDSSSYRMDEDVPFLIPEINHDHIRVNYDAGNVMDYLRLPPEKVLADLRACADEVRSFCIKDHRDFPPPHQDCGPGLGEIDHYRLLHPVAFTGRVMPLCCENIFAPRVPRPTKPEGVDALARRARERGVPRSHVVREALREYLAQPLAPALDPRAAVELFRGTMPLDRAAIERDAIARQIRAHNWRE